MSVGLLALAGSAAVKCGEATLGPSGRISEVVVTAYKEEQPENTVGMSITAATEETLRNRGINAVEDLPALVPGLTLQQAAFNSTSITLRGVGFFNSDLDTPPAVTVYVDEAPLSYPAMTTLAAFDLARVEVLKGPQGTLFGENSTGGAANYIAAKPTGRLASGVDASYGSFNRIQLGGFISGPIGDELRGRFAMQVRHGDPWQHSITRQADKLGATRELQSRGTFEWQPTARFTSRLTLTATHDESDSLGVQFIAPQSTIPALAVPGVSTFPVVTRPRAADWTPVRQDDNTPFPYASDTTLLHTSWQNDYSLRDVVTLTSLTSYAHLQKAYGQDQDGTPFHLGGEAIDQRGRIGAFYQELRLTGRKDELHWLLGLNYANDKVFDEPLQFFKDAEASHVFQSIDPQAYADESYFMGRLHAETLAAFGRLEYPLSSRLLLEGGVRFNSDRRTFDHCAFVVTDHLARFWNLFRGGAQPLTRVGDCYVVDPANGFRPVTDVHATLNQNSVPWRVGLDWTVRQDVMIYANVSKGFKAGASPSVAGATTTQFTPVPQESLLAYEMGLKAGLFDRRAQLNTSVFYYDYRDKQLRGSELDPVFGPLESLVSIPKSHTEGAETQLFVQPIDGLTIDTSATYLRTQVDRFTGFDALAHFGDQSGTPFPFAPKWQSITNIDYAFPLSAGMKAFIGGAYAYNSKTYAGVGGYNILRIDAFGLLDLRAGIERNDGRYRLWAWGKNVTNEYRWSNTFASGNSIARFVGQPATFGISLSGRF